MKTKNEDLDFLHMGLPYYTKLQKQLAGPIAHNENILVLTPPLYGWWHIAAQITKLNVTGKHREISFGEVYFYEPSFAEAQYNELEFANVFTKTNAKTYQQSFSEICKILVANKETTVFITIPQETPYTKITAILAFLQKFYAEQVKPNGAGFKIRFVVNLTLITSFDNALKLTSKYSSLTQNVLTLPYYTDQEILYFIKLWGNKWQVKITQQTAASIVACAGGVTLIAKAAVRALRNNKELQKQFTISALHQDFSFITQVKYFLNSLSQGQLDELNTVLQNPSFTPQTLEYTGIYGYKFGECNIRSLSVRHMFKPQYCDVFERIEQSKIFTQQEKKVLNLLSQNTNKVITRAQIAAIFWGNADYSEWALDKRMSRLKQKTLPELAEVDFKIKTHKKVGWSA